MSLNAGERATTSAELTDNLIATGLPPEDMARDLAWTMTRLRAAFAVDGADPTDTWELRDYLVETLRTLGRSGVPFTVLTEGARVLAQGWFALRRPPMHTPVR